MMVNELECCACRLQAATRTPPAVVLAPSILTLFTRLHSFFVSLF